MSIHKQNPNGKGSLRLIQVLVNDQTSELNAKIQEEIPALAGREIIWVSPLKESYEEYRDSDFLKAVGLDPFVIKLNDFWPSGGPQWDALAKTDSGQVILVEAKANIPEMKSNCSAKAPASISLIHESLDKTQEYLGVNPKRDWMKEYYQAANRLAHLYFLRQRCGIDAYLLNLYFIGAVEVNGPESSEDWKKAIDLQKEYLGLQEPNRLSNYYKSLFF